MSADQKLWWGNPYNDASSDDLPPLPKLKKLEKEKKPKKEPAQKPVRDMSRWDPNVKMPGDPS